MKVKAIDCASGTRPMPQKNKAAITITSAPRMTCTSKVLRSGQRERRDQNGHERFLHQVAEGRFGGVGVFEGFLNFLFQLEKAKLQIFVAERFDFGLEGVNSRDIGLQFFDVALVLGADESRDYAVNNLRCIHE